MSILRYSDNIKLVQHHIRPMDGRHMQPKLSTILYTTKKNKSGIANDQINNCPMVFYRLLHIVIVTLRGDSGTIYNS